MTTHSKAQTKAKVSSVPVTVMNQYGESTPGTAQVTVLSTQQAFWKGAKRSAKLIGIVAMILLCFAFLEPFLFMVWGSVALVFLVLFLGPYLHLRFASETKSFEFVKAKCPHCASKEPLKPYLSTRFDSEFKVICPSCGQTSEVVQK